jgi:hypothetical protein
MAFTTPGTAVAGEVLTAAFWNTNVRDNVDAIRASQINIQSTAKTDTFTMSGTTFTDVDGLSVTITPSSESSKILIIPNLMMGAQVGITNLFARLLRGSTVIAVGGAAGSRTQTTIFGSANAANSMGSMAFLDSPNTVSAITYKIQIRAQSASAVYINRDSGDSDSLAAQRNISTITAIEVPV